ncbi:hypothetical protein ZWY2020_042460 [Hordeum vulgare]|nr:hypothetical protein ZWY2020_019270 [Hordeum vulgare]KAI5017572.1 hypothetical protein ZWY2020_042460 [Hordeum vulgare]
MAKDVSHIRSRFRANVDEKTADQNPRNNLADSESSIPRSNDFNYNGPNVQLSRNVSRGNTDFIDTAGPGSSRKRKNSLYLIKMKLDVTIQNHTNIIVFMSNSKCFL